MPFAGVFVCARAACSSCGLFAGAERLQIKDDLPNNFQRVFVEQDTPKASHFSAAAGSVVGSRVQGLILHATNARYYFLFQLRCGLLV